MKIQAFRNDRLAKIVADETPVPLINGSKLILHVVPYAAFAPGFSLAVTDMRKQQAALVALDGSGWSSRVNIDGIANFSSADQSGKHSFYVQAFRTGAIEAVDALTLGWDGKKTLPEAFVAECLLRTVKSYLVFLNNLQVPPPVVVMCALLGVRGFTFASVQAVPWRRIPIDRDVLMLPEAIIDGYEREPSSILQSTLDSLWHAGGRERCDRFDT